MWIGFVLFVSIEEKNNNNNNDIKKRSATHRDKEANTKFEFTEIKTEKNVK